MSDKNLCFLIGHLLKGKIAMKKGRKTDRSVYNSFVLVMQFGINMIVPICMMMALGMWIDKKANTSYWVIILFFVGAIAGGQNIYRMAKKVYDHESKK